MNGYGFTEPVRRALSSARHEASALGHEYVGTEHILLGLLDVQEGMAYAILDINDVDPSAVRDRVYEVVKRGSAKSEDDLPYSARAKKVLELAMKQATDLGRDHVSTGHLLLGTVREAKGIGAQVLVECGLELDAALRVLGELTRSGRVEDGAPNQTALAMTGRNAAMMLRAMIERPDIAAVFLRHQVDVDAICLDLSRLP